MWSFQIIVGAAVAAAWGVTTVVYPEFNAWAAFSLAVVTGNWDPCFYSNRFISSLFTKVPPLSPCLAMWAWVGHPPPPFQAAESAAFA